MKKVYVAVFLIFFLISLLLYSLSVMIVPFLNSPKNHTETLVELDDLAKVLEQQDEISFKKAVSSYKEALLQSEKTFGEEAPETLKIMNSLAVLLHAKGEQEDPRSIGDVISVAGAGEVCKNTTFYSMEVSIGDGKRDTVVSARILHSTGDGRSMSSAEKMSSADKLLTEAEMLYRKTLELRSKVLGAKHKDTLISMNNLAILLVSRRRGGWFLDATALQRAVLEVRQKVLGEESPDTLRSMQNLALVLLTEGQQAPVEGETLQRSVLELRQKVLGEEHPDTLWSMENLAIFLFEYRSREDDKFLVEAEAFQRKVLELRQKILGKDAPETLRSMNYLAFFLTEKRDPKSFAEARVLLAEAKELEKNRK